MTEIETLKQTIVALEKLISIKDQTISALQSRPYYNWQQHPYWQGQWHATIGITTQGVNQDALYQHNANQGMQLCSVSGGSNV
jgi:uncharacterized protein YqfB (UPF0267 family)